jgi:dihydrofolate synthase/folylpolyglutamate synthase
VQHANAAAAIAALHALWRDDESIAPKDFLATVCAGLHAVRAPARLQSLGGDPALIVDVGHNPQAARALAEWLDAQPPARVHAVYGALADKDVAGVIAALGARIDHWHLAGLDQATPRGLAADALATVLQQTLPQAAFDAHADVATALAAARAVAQPGERILAFGSFFVAAAVLAERTG